MCVMLGTIVVPGTWLALYMCLLLLLLILILLLKYWVKEGEFEEQGGSEFHLDTELELPMEHASGESHGQWAIPV